jgi:hypothetical protein
MLTVAGIHRGQIRNTIKRGAQQQTVPGTVKEVVHAWLVTQPKTFSSEDI